MGIPVAMVEAKKREILARNANKNERNKIADKIDKTVNKVNGNNYPKMAYWPIRKIFNMVNNRSGDFC